MAKSYIPLLIIFAISVVNAIGMGIASHVLNPRRPTPQKSMPYESGMIPVGDTRARFSVKFYMVAISFIVFDLETIFLVPWAVRVRELGWGASHVRRGSGRRPDLRVEERWLGMGLSPSGIFGSGSPTFLTTKLDFVVNWSRRNSLWPMPFGTACCAIEMMASAASNYDLARFGMERMSFSPRQADVLICAGRVPYKLAPVLRRIWDQMMQPKWCISMGACASSGGVFDVYSMVQGIDTIVPVDVYIPGCPPRPEGLIYGLMMVQEKIRGETLALHDEHRAEDPALTGRPRASAEEVVDLTGPFGNSTQQNRVSGLVETDAMDRPRDRLP